MQPRTYTPPEVQGALNLDKKERVMEDEEIRLRFHGAFDAVKAAEDFPILIWLIYKAGKRPPEEIVQEHKDSAREVIQAEPVGQMAGIAAQLEHPDYLAYIKWKLSTFNLKEIV